MVVNDQLDHPHGCNEVNEGLCSDVRMNFTKLARRHIGAIIATIVHAIKYYKVSFHFGRKLASGKRLKQTKKK